jgi:predicted metalloprotease with PDZ domain
MQLLAPMRPVQEPSADRLLAPPAPVCYRRLRVVTAFREEFAVRPLLLLAALGLLIVGAARADDPPAIGAELSIDNDTLVVDNIVPGGPAEKAGLKAGDVIIKINNLQLKEKGLTAKEVEAAGNEILKQKPGDKIKLTVKREGKEHKLELTVGK